MSLSDLTKLAESIRMERRRLTPSEKQRRWVARNREKWNAYRRQWRQARREKGLPVT